MNRLKTSTASWPLLSGHVRRHAASGTARFVAYEALHRQRFVTPSLLYGS